MRKKFKKGAASFYIVAFSTLILVIIATSFATVIISEVTRASNDDLSQSAYDAALAGVEDAKLAYANYRRCLAKAPANGYADELSSGDEITCQDIVYWMNHANCDMVAHIIGRIGKYESKEVMVSDTSSRNDGVESNLNQAYTCVKIKTELEDYRASLTTSSQMRAVKIEFADTETGVNAANGIDHITFSWYSVRKNEILNFGNFIKKDGIGKVAFQPVMSTAVATPPVVSLQMVQTGASFRQDDFEYTSNNRTNRATMFFVPTDNFTAASRNNKIELDSSVRSGNASDATYSGIYYTSDKTNKVSAEQVVKTNDHYIKNLPFLTYCDTGTDADFYCSVDIELPRPYISVGEDVRNADTFIFLVSLPYGEPDTDFAIGFYDNDGIEYVKGVQIDVDSTGRANDLFRRVVTRLETRDTAFPYMEYALQLFGGGADNNSDTITKTMIVTCESGVINCD